MRTIVKGEVAPRGGQARTRLARRAVVDAACALFVDRGYQATTIEAISDRSEVPTATVYRLFSSKLGILKAVLDVSIAGDDQATAVAERPEVVGFLSADDPAELLAGFVGFVVTINLRTNDVHRVLSSAAAADPAAAVLQTEYQRQRAEGQRRIARRLAGTNALRRDLRQRDAADLIHALMSPELFRLLVSDRGWTPARYERWLTQTLTDQLLPPPTAR